MESFTAVCRWIYIQLAVAMYIVWVTPVRVVGAEHKLLHAWRLLYLPMQSSQHTWPLAVQRLTVRADQQNCQAYLEWVVTAHQLIEVSEMPLTSGRHTSQQC